MGSANWAALPKELLLYVVAPLVAAVNAGGADAPAARAALACARASCRSWRVALSAALRSLQCCFSPRNADALELVARSDAPPSNSARLLLTGVKQLRLSRLPPTSWIYVPSTCARSWSSLCTLDFSDCHWLGGAALDSLAGAKLPHLHTLSFARCRSPDLDDANGKRFSTALKPLAGQLLVLNLEHACVPTCSLLLLSGSLTRLRMLNLRGHAEDNRLADETLLFNLLSALSTHARLEHVDLWHTVPPSSFGDDEARDLAPLTLGKKATILQFVSAFSRTLRSLDLRRRAVSRTLRDALKARFPLLRVASKWDESPCVFREAVDTLPLGTIVPWHAFRALLQEELAELKDGEWDDCLVSPRALLGATEGAVWRMWDVATSRCCALVLPVARTARLVHSAPLLCSQWKAAGPVVRVALDLSDAGPLENAIEAACSRVSSVHCAASMRLAAMPLSYHAWNEDDEIDADDVDFEAFDFGNDSGNDLADEVFNTPPSWVDFRGRCEPRGSPAHERSILLAFARATSGFSTAPPASMADVDARSAARRLLVLRAGHNRGAMARCGLFPLEFAAARLVPPLPRTRLESAPAPRWLKPGSLCRAWGRAGCSCHAA